MISLWTLAYVTNVVTVMKCITLPNSTVTIISIPLSIIFRYAQMKAHFFIFIIILSIAGCGRKCKDNHDDSYSYRHFIDEQCRVQMMVYLDSLRCAPCWLQHIEDYHEYIALSDASPSFSISFVLFPSIEDRNLTKSVIENSSYLSRLCQVSDKKILPPNSVRIKHYMENIWLIDNNGNLLISGGLPINSKRNKKLLNKINEYINYNN